MIGMLKKALSGVHYSQRGAIMKNITSSVYSFEKLRREGYLYVDKTEFIWKLINPAGESYFLSRLRPHREKADRAFRAANQSMAVNDVASERTGSLPDRKASLCCSVSVGLHDWFPGTCFSFWLLNR